MCVVCVFWSETRLMTVKHTHTHTHTHYTLTHTLSHTHTHSHTLSLCAFGGTRRGKEGWLLHTKNIFRMLDACSCQVRYKLFASVSSAKYNLVPRLLHQLMRGCVDPLAASLVRDMRVCDWEGRRG